MLLRLLLTGLAAGVAVAPAVADNWPQWRGPTGDGLSTETGLPTEWGPDKNVAWKFRLPGRGSSTPCVWGDRIFLTALDGTDRVVLCVGTDGAERWRRKLGTGSRTSYKGDEGDEKKDDEGDKKQSGGQGGEKTSDAQGGEKKGNEP